MIEEENATESVIMFQSLILKTGIKIIELLEAILIKKLMSVKVKLKK